MVREQDWKEIWKRKATKAKNLRKASDNYIASVYSGVAEGKSLRDLIRQVRSVKALNLRMGLPYDKEAERYALSLAKRMRKRKPNGLIGAAVIEWALRELSREDAFGKTSAIANGNARSFEAKEKEALMSRMISEAQKQADSMGEAKSMGAKVFYLCSWHGDCAEDHADWQGKLYYDRFWRRHVKNEYVRAKVESLIQERNMKSIQWVTNSPVWLITRPNCRHYFEAVSVEDAMEGSDAELLEERGMRKQTGMRDSGQTIRHPIDKGWYTQENVKAIISKYEDRLDYHRTLFKVCPSDLLRDYMAKDGRLISKWKRYLRTKIKE